MYHIKEKRWSVVDCNTDDGPSPRMGHLLLYNHLTSSHPENDFSFYVHGGMAETKFLDDLFRLDIRRVSGVVLSQLKHIPSILTNVYGTDSVFFQLPATETTSETRVTGIWRNMREEAASKKNSEEGGDYCGDFWPQPRAGHGGAIMPSPGRHSHPCSRIFIFGGVNSNGALNELTYFDEGEFHTLKLNTFALAPNLGHLLFLGRRENERGFAPWMKRCERKGWKTTRLDLNSF